MAIGSPFHNGGVLGGPLTGTPIMGSKEDGTSKFSVEGGKWVFRILTFGLALMILCLILA